MRKIFILCVWLFLSGCILRPQYYNSTDIMQLGLDAGKKPTCAEHVDGSRTCTSIWTVPVDPAETTIIIDSEQYAGNKEIPLKRSFFDKTVIIKKDGFKDYELELQSQWTNEGWATALVWGGPETTSAWGLLMPVHTLESIALIPAYGQGLLWLPVGLVVDAYNILIGGPSVVLSNPWRNYEMEEHTIILDPTDEYKRVCHKKKNTLVTNRGCVDCNFADKLIASAEECARCPDRFFDKNTQMCLLKSKKWKLTKQDKMKCHAQNGFMTEFGCVPCNTTADYRISEILSSDECNYCSNRFVAGYLEKWCSDKLTVCNRSKERSIYGINCEEERKIVYIDNKPSYANTCHEKENTFYADRCLNCDAMDVVKTSKEECQRCPNREYTKNGYCELIGTSNCHSQKGTFFTSQGCKSCEAYNTYETNMKECSRCPYRTYPSHYSNRCELNIEKFVREKSIQELVAWYKKNLEKYHSFWEAHWSPFFSELEKSGKFEKFAQSVCPKGTPLMADDGSCHACDEESIFYAASSKMAKFVCPAREEFADVSFLNCGDKLIGADGKCHAYDEADPIETPFVASNSDDSNNYINRYLRTLCEKPVCDGKPCRHLNIKKGLCIKNSNWFDWF